MNAFRGFLRNKDFELKDLRPSGKQLKKMVAAIVFLVLFIFAVNPRLIPFTTPEFKASVGDVWGSLFGDVDTFSSMFTINWATIFRLIAMVLFMYILNILCRFVISLLRPRDNRIKSRISFLSNLINYLISILGIIWGLSILGVNVSAIFAGVSILALAVSFGAESLIEDVITGVFLAMDNEFNVGDIIEIDGFRGTVKAIGVRSTYIQDAGGNVQTINNSDIRKVLNRSMSESIAVCDVSISYSADLEQVEAILQELLPPIREKYPDTFLAAPQYVGVQDLGDSAVILRIIAPVKEADIYAAPRLIRREIKIGFDRHGVEIPFRQVVIHQAEK